MQAAIDIIEYFRKCAIEIFALAGSSKYSKVESLVLNYLRENTSGTATEIWEYIRGEIYSITTKEVQTSLKSMAGIKESSRTLQRLYGTEKD